jgi:alpha/beta superfamily hydrolase
LFAFDFAGCGNSEGEYISLGYYEREDVDVVFKYLRSLETVSSIGIFGRSMGAVTALMYSDRNHEIGCLVLDSPFSNL